MRFFVDNCISPNLVEGIRVLAKLQRYEITYLREKFPEDTGDVEWLDVLSEEGDWVIVSGDPRISRAKAERAAWHESGLTAFFFAARFSRKKYWKQAEVLVRWWPRIVLEARSAVPGSGYVMPLEGKEFRKIYAPSE